MKHLGNITKINGAEIEIVDVITGGSPCQDLSIAGKRAGLAGARSGLFMEQVRIVKEMREHDRANGRTGDMVRPRFMVWENVPGAFSSNKGRDFAAVLEEIIRIAEPEAPDIEVPKKGWPTWGGYHDELGGRWSVAWRVHDAQHWGVPQRRRRISVVADFGGDTAGEILFERKSVSRHPTESGTARERLAEAAERGFNPAVGDCMTAWDCQSKRIFDTNGKSPTLQGGVGGGVNNPAIFAAIPINDQTIFTPIPINPMVATRCKELGRGTGFGVGEPGDPANTISASHSHGVFATAIGNQVPLAYGIGNGQACEASIMAEEIAQTLNTMHDAQAVMCEDVSHALAAAPSGTNQTPAVVALDMSHACDVIRDCGEIVPSLQARMGTGGNQIQLTYQMQGFGDYREGDVASSCKQRDFKDSTDLVCSVDCRNFTEGGEINGTLQAKESGGQSLNLNNTVRQNMVVRRLTPLECERLQGFPDGWTDIGDWVKTGKRGRKIKVKGSADSPRYKALGNSIALPFWDFLAKRISAQYLRPVTMGSLFDGIGGFPLVFERHNGKGTARWASEIEEFPIAVTKLRFGED